MKRRVIEKRSSSVAYWDSRILFLLLLGVLVGCGDGRPARVAVGGQVTVEGKTLACGAVRFKPVEGGRTGGSSIDPQGQYSVSMYEANDGLAPGTYTVSIDSSENVGSASLRWHAPKKYAEPSTSGLKVEITEATAELNFDLTWEGDRHSKPWVEK